MKILYLLLLPSILFNCQIKPLSKRSRPNIDSTLTIAKKRKESIDNYLFKHQNQLLLLAKVTGKKNLVKVKDENWPDETECIYNILKNDAGIVIMAAQIPYSESGDWYIEYKHYFDGKGNTFAFTERKTVFDESVSGGVAVETDIKYYDRNFKTISQAFRLTDKDEKTIKRNKNEFDFRSYKYNTYKNLQDWLTAFHVMLL